MFLTIPDDLNPRTEYNSMQYKRTGLKPYTNYTVKVLAFTKKKRHPSLEGLPCTDYIMTLSTSKL